MDNTLSVIIPARNEEFLQKTIDSISEASTANTEIIVILDGYHVKLKDNPRLRVVHNQKSIGQRAACNQAVRLSKSKYIMKCDAHCSFDYSFDSKLINDCEYNWVVIPRMYVLNAFHWVCKNCKKEYEQGPELTLCEKCNHTEFERKIIWQIKKRKMTDYMWFDTDLRVKYFDGNGLREYGYYEDKVGIKRLYHHKCRDWAQSDITDVMCGVGACWFLHRDFYFEIGGLDEKHGSWGQMAVELACKTWLNGGRHVVNKKTWFAHLFRTQKDFSWPYSNPSKDQEKCREYSKNLWLNNKWEKRKYNLSYLIDKFSPLPGWEKENMKDESKVIVKNDIKEIKQVDSTVYKISQGTKFEDNSVTILYYTANKINDIFSTKVKDQIKYASKNIPIISISQKPVNDMGENICVGDIGQTLQNIYKQVLIGAKAAKTKYVILCEDDTLYIPEHFVKRPGTAPFAYNLNRWNLHVNNNLYSYRKRVVLGQCIAERETLIKCLEERFTLPSIPKEYCGEMGVFERKLGIQEYKYETFNTIEPNVVIAHFNNTTGIKLTGKDDTPCKDLLPFGNGERLLNILGLKVEDNKKNNNTIAVNNNTVNFSDSEEEKMAKFGRGSKERSQHSYIGSIIFSMDEIMNELFDYADTRKPGRVERRMEVIPPFLEKVADGKQFTDDELKLDPYYNYLVELLNPADRFPVVSGKGQRHVIKLMREMIFLYNDIKENGLKNPLHMYRDGKKLVLHQGWRRLSIMHELHKKGLRDFSRVPVRIFKTKEIFQRYNPVAAQISGSPLEKSIHDIAQKQFIELGVRATDKYWVHNYTQYYDLHLSHLRDKALKILEIGVFRGASLLLWKQCFTNSLIYGIDKNTAIWQPFLKGQDRIKVFVGHQEDQNFLDKEVIPTGKFDIIIDDGGHTPEEQIKTFDKLWPSLNSNGYYVIEDLHGNYWNHRAKNGPLMMEKIKQMIDDVVGTNDKFDIKTIAAYYNICFIGKN